MFGRALTFVRAGGGGLRVARERSRKPSGTLETWKRSQTVYWVSEPSNSESSRTKSGAEEGPDEGPDDDEEGAEHVGLLGRPQEAGKSGQSVSA